MSYIPLTYSLEKAKKLGVVVKPSKKAGKKLDVFKHNKLVTSIGAKGMGDYPTYLQNEGKKYADERRKLYKIRHAKNTGVAGFYANQILW